MRTCSCQQSARCPVAYGGRRTTSTCPGRSRPPLPRRRGALGLLHETRAAACPRCGPGRRGRHCHHARALLRPGLRLHDHSAHSDARSRPRLAGVGRTVLLLCLMWWMYGGYAWLTNAAPPVTAFRRGCLLHGRQLRDGAGDPARVHHGPAGLRAGLPAGGVRACQHVPPRTGAGHGRDDRPADRRQRGGGAADRARRSPGPDGDVPLLDRSLARRDAGSPGRDAHPTGGGWTAERASSCGPRTSSSAMG